MNGKAILRFVALVAIYLVVALPFQTMEIIKGFTNVRPVMALGPIYAVFFGPAGCLASAVGNLLSDVLTGAVRVTSIHGFVANFVGPLLVWLYWTRVSRTPFSLRTPRDALRHSLVVVAAAALEMVFVAKAVALVYPEISDELFAKAIFANMTLFPILIGIPVSALLQDEFGFVPHDKRLRAAAAGGGAAGGNDPAGPAA